MHEQIHNLLAALQSLMRLTPQQEFCGAVGEEGGPGEEPRLDARHARHRRPGAASGMWPAWKSLDLPLPRGNPFTAARLRRLWCQCDGVAYKVLGSPHLWERFAFPSTSGGERAKCRIRSAV